MGRGDELAVLLRALEGDGPLVTFVHGVAGIGKSTLLEAFSRVAHDRGATVLRVDCASIEPTERGFRAALAMAGAPDEGQGQLASPGTAGERLLILVDTFEAFRISDAWMRRDFLPSLPANTRVVIAGTEAPSFEWFGPLGWSGSVAVLELGPLEEHDACELLRSSGLTAVQAHSLNRVARGHPLALRVAAGVASYPGPALGEIVAQRVLEELSQRYLRQIPAPTRRALDAASVVRRATVSLLGAMLEEDRPNEAADRLLALPFVRATPDGLAIHATLQQAVATQLRSEDPARHQRYRQAAWRQLRAEVRDVGASELWRYTADMLYLIDNPMVREAFFPATAQLHTVEPAGSADGPAILETVTRHEGREAAALAHAWWERAPTTFRVVRGRDGAVAGFYQVFEAGAPAARAAPHDPIVVAWRDHLRRVPVGTTETVLFSRRMLDRERGESAGPVQAAVFLDVKRLYMTLRPRLRRIYWTARSVLDSIPALAPLGFVPLPEVTVKLDGLAYPTVMNDFGPGSIDGWLAGVAAREIGIPADELLDLAAREVVTAGGRTPLTALEFKLLHYLMQRERKAVARADLIQDVWGHSYAGDSNVVEVAVRQLRRKLADRAAVIETVRGVGYRYRRH